MSTNNFGGDFAEPFGVGASDKPCWCGSTNFKIKNENTEIDPIMLRPIDDLEFPDAILTILKPDIYYIGDLVISTDEKLLALPDFTEEFLREVKDVLASRGLTLGCRLDVWPEGGIGLDGWGKVRETEQTRERYQMFKNDFVWLGLDAVVWIIEYELTKFYRPQVLKKDKRLGRKRLECLRFSIEKLITDSIPLIVGRTKVHRYASIHKRSNYYSGHRYEPSLTYKIHIKTAYEGMISLGYLKEEKKGVSEGALGKYLTRYSATPSLLALFGSIQDPELLPVDVPSNPLEEPLIVKVKRTEKDKNGKKRSFVEYLDYQDSDRTNEMRENLSLINENLRKHWLDLALDDELVHEIRKILASENTQDDEYPETFNLAKKYLHRSFLDTEFSLGGRFYGGWWQIIPKLFRSHIVIDGKPTIELDFSRLHPSFLYSLSNIEPPLDSYDIGLNKDHKDEVKLAFNALLNARPNQKLKQAPRKLNIRKTGITWTEMRRRLLELHRPIQHHFFTGIGAQLQFKDSQIAERIMLRFIKEKSGAVVLPVHDSFIVHHGYENELAEMMVEEFKSGFGREIKLGKLKRLYEPMSARPSGQPISMEIDDILANNNKGWVKRFELFTRPS
ncbi:MAG: hypothetical protein VW829_03220 [Deltaproteobacteria bacterium]